MNTYVNAVVPRPSRKVFPRRIPDAPIEEKARTVITAVLPSEENQVAPGPSFPVGQRTFWILLNWELVEEGDASIWAFWRGTGTSDEE
jgi:hypothetical protein